MRQIWEGLKSRKDLIHGKKCNLRHFEKLGRLEL